MRRSLMLLLLCVVVASGGCGGSGSSTSSGTPAVIVVNASPARADVDAGGSVTVDAYATVTGDASQGSALSFSLQGAGTMAVTGPGLFGDYSVVYTAPGSPTSVNSSSLVGTSASITITSKSDTSKTVVVPFTLHDNINFPSQHPPDALVGSAYSYTLHGSGGTGTLTYQVVSTSMPLPPGLTLASTGVLSGTPTAMGVYSFTVVAYDQATKVVGIAQTITMQVS